MQVLKWMKLIWENPPLDGKYFHFKNSFQIQWNFRKFCYLLKSLSIYKHNIDLLRNPRDNLNTVTRSNKLFFLWFLVKRWFFLKVCFLILFYKNFSWKVLKIIYFSYEVLTYLNSRINVNCFFSNNKLSRLYAFVYNVNVLFSTIYFNYFLFFLFLNRKYLKFILKKIN